MDLEACAEYFQNDIVKDAYTGVTLFEGQLTNYDMTLKDTPASWRRSVATTAYVAPSRGAVGILDTAFIAGRVVKDFLDGDEFRRHVLLIEADGLFTGTPVLGLLSGSQMDPQPFYGAADQLKAQKEEEESSQLFNQQVVYCWKDEPLKRGWVLVTPTDRLLRVQSIEFGAGEAQALIVTELDEGALTQITLTRRGDFNTTTETYAETVTEVPCLLERYQNSYRYLSKAATKYEQGDMVATVSPLSVEIPNPGDVVATVAGVSYNIVSAQSESGGEVGETVALSLHLRPV